jgi:hypothetical protein
MVRMSETEPAKTEQANTRNIRDWETERVARADGYAAVLTHLNAAIDAVPNNDLVVLEMANKIDYIAFLARGRLRAVMNESNPFRQIGEKYDD